MASAVGSIIRKATRKPGDKLNILTFPTHEAYETNLCRTGHMFWAVRGPGIKDWETAYRPLPKNYILLDPHLRDQQLPGEIDFDLILSQNKFGQFQWAKRLSQIYHLPIVSLEHTLPMEAWGEAKVKQLKKQKGHINLFISEYSRKEWLWDEKEAAVIHHGINTEEFKPSYKKREKHCLSVVNDWVNRDIPCGFTLWKQASAGLPVKVLGNTPGLSKPAGSQRELITAYQTSRIFLNTSLVSPIPSSLLEAMATGAAIVSTANCMIPEIIQHGKNGLLGNTAEELRKHCQRLLVDDALAEELGRAARQTIIESFGLDKFVENWNRVFELAASLPYYGDPE